MSSSLECQATSVEPRTCCESGEERTTETAFPLGHDQQKLPSRLERFHPLVTMRLEGVDAARYSMARRVGVVLQDHLSRFVERECETAEPAKESPQQTGRDDGLMKGTFGIIVFRLLHAIADLLTFVPHRGAIGGRCWSLARLFPRRTLRHIQILLGPRDQPRRSEAFIGQHESWDSR